MAEAWLADLLSLFADFQPASWSACQADRAVNGINGTAIETFVNKAPTGTTLYLWTGEHVEPKKVNVIRKREVEVEELIPVDDGGGTEAEEKKGESGEGADAPPPATRIVTRIIEETVQELQRVVVQTVLASLAPPGAIGAAGARGSVAYVVKLQEGRLSPPGSNPSSPEVIDYMSAAVEYGVWHGGATELVGAMQSAVTHVYSSLLEPQLAPRGLAPSGGHSDARGHPASTLGGDVESFAGGDSQSMTSAVFGAVGSLTERSFGGGGFGSTIGGGGGRRANLGTTVRSVLSPSTTHGGAGGGGGGQMGARIVQAAPAVEDRTVSSVADAVRGEFRSSLSRFATVMSQTIQQVSGGGTRLTMPPADLDVPAPADVEKLSGESREALISIAERWVKVISVAQEPPKESAKGSKPLSEVECWRNRSAALASLSEQLSSPTVKAVIAALEALGERVVESFSIATVGLAKASAEASDNVKFLSTLERLFKTLATAPLNTVIEALPSLFNGLRMVWVISHGYSTDDAMLPLLRRIASELSERVTSEVGSLKALFRAAATEPTEVLSVLKSGIAVLEGWRENYQATRERLEAAAGDHYWDFDRRVLFERSDHIAIVLTDLVYIVDTTSQLSAFFRGNELRALANDADELSSILTAVERLSAPFSKNAWSPWEKSRAARWRSEVNNFGVKVEEIETRTQAFIAAAFSQLRSAESAFDFLAKLSTIPMRESLRALLDGNAINIVAKARAELAEVVALFEAKKDAPPVWKNVPPIAGAIAWANALYARQKRPVVRIKAIMPALFNTPEGAALRQEYLAFARAVEAYTKGHFSAWCARAKAETADLLKLPVLAPGLLSTPLTVKDVFAIAEAEARGPTAVEVARQATTSVKAPRGLGRMALAVAASTAAIAANPSLLRGDRTAALLPPPPYTVNFSPALYALIRECKLLDGMGYALPEVAMAVALAEASLSGYIARIFKMLERYHGTLAALAPVEACLMQTHLARLQLVLRPGFSPLSWNSLHIGAYIDEVQRTLNDFDSTLDQVRKSSAMLEDVSRAIHSASLIPAASFDTAINVDIADVYEQIERQCASTLRGLIARFNTTGPIMRQIEGVITGTDTGAAPLLAEFYLFWERRIFNSITSMTLTSMATFEGLLSTIVVPHNSALISTPFSREPLIRVRAIFSPAPEVVLTPDINTVISKYLRKAGMGLIRSAGSFQRWMDGTCLPVETLAVAPGEAPPDFSYFRDVSANSAVVTMLLTYQPGVLSVINQARDFTQQCSRIGSQYGLWTPRRVELDRKAPPVTYFDTRISTFSRLAAYADEQPTYKDIGFLRIDISAVLHAIKTQALKLRADNARILLELSQRRLNDVRAKIAERRSQLDVVPTDLESLKGVLGAVAVVMESRSDMDAAITDVADWFSTLATHNLVPAGTDEAAAAAAANGLPAEWQSLVDYALTRDARLVRIKDKFRVQTRDDVIAFKKEADDLAKLFSSTGPAAPGITLAIGLAAMTEFKGKLAKANKTRDDFSMAERLFGLPMTLFTQLGGIKESIDLIQPLYDLYAERLALAESNSATAWSDLDMGTLTKGAEELGKRLAKLKDLKVSPVYALVADEISGFKDSLPLISSLKNPAMKDRHWDAIAKLTGIKIPPIKSLTLGAIFAMNLARYAESVEDQCTQAKGELKIEKDLKSIEEKWKGTVFTIVAYKKNGEVRGQTLRPDETLRQFLDDDMMNLAAIAGSRFVPIFSAQVSDWDKKLNLVSECVEVWLVVQTKWAYLEGIFIGSEDIKMQLPEEAKRFAAIDKDFKAIMTSTVKDPNVVTACCEPGRLATLSGLGERLDDCQKSLSEYLYTKRNAFPRFFFVSDDELLSVLGSSDPNSIQVHMLKLFDNVKSISLRPAASGGNKLAVAAMASSEGEAFDTVNPSIVDGPVETWMLLAEGEMHASLHSITKEGVFGYADAVRTDWIEKVLGMVACVGSQIWWTWETEDVFRRVRTGDKYAMKLFAERQTKQLTELVAKVRGNISRILRAKVNTLLIIDVHARDIIDSFVRDSVLDAREFAWESQLRFYWSKDIDDIRIRQCTGSFSYGFEYMGLNGRLVITPLTDRAYLISPLISLTCKAIAFT